MSNKVTVEFSLYEDKTDDKTELSFCTDENMSLARLHGFCKAFAYALGFAEKSIERYFGPDKEAYDVSA